MKTIEDARKANFSDDFIRKMENRVLTSYFKYGEAEKNAKTGDFPANIKQRVDKYLVDGNIEWLVDAANFAMLEFMYPQHQNAHFRATSSGESPGIVMRDGTQWHGDAGQDFE